ncbi:hypothetical protein ACQKDD_00910 [Planococcus kocurii]|uniref:Uncharacterized protein n=1 Tax=Planococcus kocurii TaxID=1374 RepID=A0ABM5WXE3_9BACL|nr:hypothetical protein [Planococcus kocurii]ALS79009.1 hypothetical protein AUO94_10205 [Planococcus kocurii]
MSWTKKSESDRLAPTGIRRSGEAAFFAAQAEWLMTRGAGHLSWTKKSESDRLAPTGIRRSGEAAFFAAQAEWLMTQGA